MTGPGDDADGATAAQVAAAAGVLVIPFDPWHDMPARVRALVEDVRGASATLLGEGRALGECAHDPGGDAEAIHDFRVALRRLRSVLKPLRPSAGRAPMRKLADRLREIAASTGELRDEEVLRETLSELELDRGTRSALDLWMIGRRRREAGLRARVLRALRADAARGADGALEATLRALELRLEAPPRRPVGDAAFARHALDEAWDAVLERTAGSLEAGGEALHRLRIALKRLRYAAEVFGDRAPYDARVVEKRAAKLQKLLGHLHDLDEASARMSRAWGLEPLARAAVLAALHAAREAALRRVARDVPRELVGILDALTPAAAPR